MPTRPHRILATSRRRGPPTRPELALLEQAMRRAASAAVVATDSSPVGSQLHPTKATPITSPSGAITGPGNPQRDITQHTVDNSSNDLHEFDTIKDVLHRQLHGGLVCSCFSIEHQDVDDSGIGTDSGIDIETLPSRQTKKPRSTPPTTAPRTSYQRQKDIVDIPRASPKAYARLKDLAIFNIDTLPGWHSLQIHPDGSEVLPTIPPTSTMFPSPEKMTSLQDYVIASDSNIDTASPRQPSAIEKLLHQPRTTPLLPFLREESAQRSSCSVSRHIPAEESDRHSRAHLPSSGFETSKRVEKHCYADIFVQRWGWYRKQLTLAKLAAQTGQEQDEVSRVLGNAAGGGLEGLAASPSLFTPAVLVVMGVISEREFLTIVLLEKMRAQAADVYGTSTDGEAEEGEDDDGSSTVVPDDEEEEKM